VEHLWWYLTKGDVFLQWITAMTHGIKIFKQWENQQACYEFTPLQQTKPIHHQHAPVK
jgi:hypothetical protein